MYKTKQRNCQLINKENAESTKVQESKQNELKIPYKRKQLNG